MCGKTAASAHGTVFRYCKVTISDRLFQEDTAGILLGQILFFSCIMSCGSDPTNAKQATTGLPVIHILDSIRQSLCKSFWEKEGEDPTENRSSSVYKTWQPWEILPKKKHHGGHHRSKPSHHGHPSHSVLTERTQKKIT